jgi:hypothetical protein
MRLKIKYSSLKTIIREALLLEKEDNDKERGPVDKMKGWQPPSHMTQGSDATSWASYDEWDGDGGAFDMGLDEADDLEEEDQEEGHHEE